MATACPTTVASAQSNSEMVPITTPVPTLLQKANDQVQTLISQYGNAMALSCASLASTPAAAAAVAQWCLGVGMTRSISHGHRPAAVPKPPPATPKPSPPR